MNEIEKLLQSEYHEVRLFALYLLVLRFSKGDLDEQTEIYQLMKNTLMSTVTKWILFLGGHFFWST